MIQASADAARRDARAAAQAAGQDPAPRPAGVERIEAFLTAIDLLAKAHPDDDSGADRTTLIIHADAEQLAPAEPGQDHLEMVETVSGSHRRRATMSVRTLRRLACDARYALIGHDPDGDTTGVSGTTRRIPSRLRRALLARDRTCRFPGCHRTRGLHGHHIIPVEHDGPTVLTTPTHSPPATATPATTTTPCNSSTKNSASSNPHPNSPPPHEPIPRDHRGGHDTRSTGGCVYGLVVGLTAGTPGGTHGRPPPPQP